MINNIGPILTIGDEDGKYFTSYKDKNIAVIESIENQPERIIAIFKATQEGLEEAEKFCDDLNDRKL